MTIEIDETMQIFLEESMDHLADIENDFLRIEEAGADIDEDLINKVYRAAHSIKGGAGFMGLTNIQNLTHAMENILGKIRSREMVPNSAIVSKLLEASDVLRDMIQDVTTSNDVDISEQLSALKAIDEGEPAAPAEEAAGDEDVPAADEEPLEVDQAMVSQAREEGKFIYEAAFDLVADIHAKGIDVGEYISDIEKTGSVLAANVDLEKIKTLDEDSLPDQLPVRLLFATIFHPEDINDLFQLGSDQVRLLEEEKAEKAPAPDGEAPGRPEQPGNPPSAQKDAPVFTPVTAEASTGNDDAVSEKAKPEAPPQTKKPAAKKPAAKSKPAAPKPKAHSAAGGATGGSTMETSLRVHVSLLDSLMDLAGELVLGRNQLMQAINTSDTRLSEAAAQRIDLITSELQEAIMLTRMQAIGNVFGKFPRVVRDLSRKLGKQVELTLEGKEVELDKTIIEAINDPLTHLVRNAVDHGIEPPEQRQAAGKNPTGTIALKAYHEAGQVNVVISDDGKGLDGEVLAEAAIEKGLITEEQAQRMSDKEKIQLIFLPGFSTAKKVTDVSGRGVGMDVVKTNLDKLGGQTEIESKPGKGTTIRIKLPLTLAIIPSQIVTVGRERYAIPQVNLVELLRIPAEKVKTRVETVGDAEVVRLRGDLLPLVRLADIIGIQRRYREPDETEEKPDRRMRLADRRSPHTPSPDETSQSADNADDETPHRRVAPFDRRQRAASALNIAVVAAGPMKYGLVVDGMLDSEEIVVKPLGAHLKSCKGYAGATIMGDGRVALILDVGYLARMAGLNQTETVDGQGGTSREEEEAAALADERQSMLVFRCDINEHFAVPVSLVERIEKIRADDIEQIGGKRVMKYRGGSLPLFSIDQVAQVQPLTENESHLAIVFNLAGRELGLLATGPVDAVEMVMNVDGQTLRQPGIMGSMVIDGHTTLMVDIYELVQTLEPEWFSEREAHRDTEEVQAATILYAEDSAFFRSQVKRFMEEEGFTVIEAEDGVEAWRLLQEHADEISLVATDIEMPNMDGFTFTETLRADERFANIPVIALTTLASEADQAKGKAVGIDDYQIKLDREKLIGSIHDLLQTTATGTRTEKELEME